ncbi:uncharacterized protein JCM6883_001651 [Sporobolomyces salmoneus]|uniref:uncharacterized protein n=1 Tax=Sporobolomyces salmoneus TaxID=183962 RepID=UPI0031794671
MGFGFLQRRCSQASSISSTSSDTSTASLYFPLEPVEGKVPKELHGLPKSTKGAAKCTLDIEKDAWSNPFSFPRSHTHHHMCPKHGLRHTPFLALPGRDERTFEAGQYRVTKVALRKSKTNKF